MAGLGEEDFDDEPLAVDDEGYEIEGDPVPEPPDEITVEARARAQGWRPGKRTPDGVSLTPQEFLDRGEEEWPILRHNNRIMSEKLARLEPEVANLRNTIAEQTQAVQDAVALAKRADERGYQRGLAELKAQRLEAVQTGDTAAFEQVQEQISAMETERQSVAAPRSPPTPPAPTPQDLDPDVQHFLKTSEWFKNDAQLRTAMINAHAALITLNPTKSQGDLLQDAIDQVDQAFPGRIPGSQTMPRSEDPPAPTPRPRAPAVLRPGGAGGNQPRPTPRSPIDAISDPAERAQAKDAYRRQAQWDPGFTEAEYMKIYNGEPDAQDVISLRKTRTK